jgi:threonylcarbamoyladenosine tRNA methylthiotransferase MtaB
MKIYLASIGCRLNQSEIETMARQLLANGHEVVQEATMADKVIINTCAVTGEAARDARKLTRRFHRQNDLAEIVLTGCYATIAPDELAQVAGVGKIINNRDKERLVRILDPRAEISLPTYDREPIMREFLGDNTSHTRAFVKVQDGCNNRCTFCVTTIARGEGQSRRMGDVVAEIRALAAAGYQEVVLTGVHMGSFGRDLDEDIGLGDLVKAILQLTDIPRLRLSSLEPWDISPHFFSLWDNPRLLPNLHVPLQSGSDQILRRMARRTTRAAFRKLVSEARRQIPELNLSTDLIAGFPGESEEDFRQSYEFVRDIGFSRLHVFTYSRRPGTAAAEMAGQVAPAVKKERVRKMIDLGRELSLVFHQRYEGQTINVLWETAVGADDQGLRWLGYSDNYIRVSATGSSGLINQVTPTRLSCAEPEGMSGLVLVKNARPALI